HQIDAVAQVVDDHAELVGPLPRAVAHQHVAGLRRRVLRPPAQPQVLEALFARVDPHPHAAGAQAAVPATAVVDAFAARAERAARGDLLARAVAEVRPAGQPLERLLVDRRVVALAIRAGPLERVRRLEAEPGQILDDRPL